MPDGINNGEHSQPLVDIAEKESVDYAPPVSSKTTPEPDLNDTNPVIKEFNNQLQGSEVQMAESENRKNSLIQTLAEPISEPVVVEELEWRKTDFWEFKIQEYAQQGGSVAELMYKLPDTVRTSNQELYTYLEEELELQNLLMASCIEDINKIQAESNPEQAADSKRHLWSTIRDYQDRWHELQSLEEKIRLMHPDILGQFQQAETEYLEFNAKNIAEMIQITQEALQELDPTPETTQTVPSSTIEASSVPNAISQAETPEFTPISELVAQPLEGATVESKNPPIISGTDPESHERRRFSIKNSVADVLPALLYMEAISNLGKGRSHSEIMMIVHSMEEMKEGSTKLEDILIKLEVPQDALRLLQAGKVHEQFFTHFKGREDKLVRFFEKIGHFSDQMYLFLKNMRHSDLEDFVKTGRLPGNIFLEKTVVETVLSKLSALDKQKLGIREESQGH